MGRRSSTRALLVLAALLAGCPEKREDPCSNESLKGSVVALAADWYLFPELLSPVDPAAYASPADLLDALTAGARAEGKDRYWSYTTTLAAQQTFFVEGTAVGFGVGLLVRDASRLFVSQVYPESAAANAGFQRGDEILGIGETPDTIVPVATLLATTDGVSNALGPATEGITRSFEVMPRGGTTADPPRTMAKTTFGLDPVPAPQIFDLTASGGPKVGYLLLRSFIAPAETLLRPAFASFQAQGVTDVIVDLRYNGGGLLSTADVLASLLGGGLQTQVMFRALNNARHAADDLAFTFSPDAASITATRVAFLVTGASASASELLPHVLDPYRPVALVGRQTYGKPVGQRGFRHSQCDLIVYLVSFKLVNAQLEGDYFGGLPAPGFAGCAIPADDDLLHDLGDPAEGQIAAALDWFVTGCPPTAPPSPLAVPLEDAYPEPLRPTEAQRHVRGLF